MKKIRAKAIKSGALVEIPKAITVDALKHQILNAIWHDKVHQKTERIEAMKDFDADENDDKNWY